MDQDYFDAISLTGKKSFTQKYKPTEKNLSLNKFSKKPNERFPFDIFDEKFLDYLKK